MSELNLLPYELRRGKQSSLNPKQLIATGLAAVLIIGAAVAVPIIRVNSLKKEKDDLQEYVNRNSGILTENTELQAKIDNIAKYVSMADSVRDSRTLAAGIIRNIEKYIPSQVVLSNLSYADGIIQISATSSDYNAICTFAANLQTSEDFAGSMINTITTTNESSTSYSTSITISFGGGETVEGTQP